MQISSEVSNCTPFLWKKHKYGVHLHHYVNLGCKYNWYVIFYHSIWNIFSFYQSTTSSWGEVPFFLNVSSLHSIDLAFTGGQMVVMESNGRKNESPKCKWYSVEIVRKFLILRFYVKSIRNSSKNVHNKKIYIEFLHCELGTPRF